MAKSFATGFNVDGNVSVDGYLATGDIGVELDGTSGYISAPDQAGIDITGRMSVIARVASNSYGAATQTIASKFDGPGTNKSWLFRISASGTLLFLWSVDGNVTTENTSTVAMSLEDGRSEWVGVTFDNSISGNRETKFWTGGNSETPTWEQLGTTVVTAGVTSIFSGTAPLVIGTYSVPTPFNLFNGTIYSTQVYDGIGANTAPGQGTLVADFDANRGENQQDGLGNTFSFNGVWDWTSNGVFVDRNEAKGSFRAPAGSKNYLATGNLGVVLDGSTGYISTPDQAGLDISGDMTIAVFASNNDWSAAAEVQQYSVAKWDSPSDRSYRFGIDNNPAGRLMFEITANGATTDSYESSVAPSFDDGSTPYHFKVEFDASASQATFYTGGTDPGNPVWVQLGTVDSGTATSVWDSAADLTLGSAGGVSNFWDGEIYRAQVYDGLLSGTSTLVADFDANRGENQQDGLGNQFAFNGSWDWSSDGLFAPGEGGDLTLAAPSGNAFMNVEGEGAFLNLDASTIDAAIRMKDAGVNRWRIEANFSDASADLEFIRYNSSGSLVDRPFEIDGATGELSLSGGSTIDGGFVVRPWQASSGYNMIGTANMTGNEYTLLTDASQTFISAPTDGAVTLRANANDGTAEIAVGPTQTVYDNDKHVFNTGPSQTDAREAQFVDASLTAPTNSTADAAWSTVYDPHGWGAASPDAPTVGLYAIQVYCSSITNSGSIALLVNGTQVPALPGGAEVANRNRTNIAIVQLDVGTSVSCRLTASLFGPSTATNLNMRIYSLVKQ